LNPICSSKKAGNTKMRETISCDEIFDVLTRGPLSLDDEPGVRSHLCYCHECRCLAEAMRPAVDLFHEVLDDDSLPRVEGIVFDATQIPPAEVPTERQSLRGKMQAQLSNWLPLFAAALAGVALLGWIGRANQDQGGSSPPPGQVDYGPLPPTHPALVASEGGTTLCCVACHRPGADHPQPSVQRLATSCMACHVASVEL
jgi:hypothetical protein